MYAGNGLVTSIAMRWPAVIPAIVAAVVVTVVPPPPSVEPPVVHEVVQAPPPVVLPPVVLPPLSSLCPPDTNAKLSKKDRAALKAKGCEVKG